MRNNKKLSMLLLVIGIIGLITTGYFIISAYFKASNVGGLLKPSTIGFIPFFISFVLLRMGIKRLSYKAN
jgi:Ni,Fe-hydrogenase I cytochrome b subunit